MKGLFSRRLAARHLPPPRCFRTGQLLILLRLLGYDVLFDDFRVQCGSLRERSENRDLALRVLDGPEVLADRFLDEVELFRARLLRRRPSVVYRFVVELCE